MTKEQFKAYWDYLQSICDIDGDVWMGLFTAFILLRIIGVPLFHWVPLTASESAAYGTAVGAFAYTNKGGKPS